MSTETLGSSTLTIGSAVGNGLNDLLTSADILPGDQPSYQLCKTIYTLHPIGKKMVDAPIAKAQSQKRAISIPDSPEDAVREQFERVWTEIDADRIIRNTFRLSRVYGLSTLVAMVPKLKPMQPIDYPNLWKVKDGLRFNVLDPLNTSGSLVMNQDPNQPDFLKPTGVSVAGVPYNMGRCVVIQNEDPIYIDYTSSGFGYVGRSVYQRSLLPLKSFIQSMITDDLVTIKAGILVAKLKNQGSFVDNIMLAMNALKRNLIKIARVGQVISVGDEDDIVSLDLTNIEGAMNGARKNILENIAVSADMPAKILNQETFAEGFGEGTEDAKAIAEYIDDIRLQMHALYVFMDRIVQHIAWNPEFYKTIQARFPEDWGSVDYEEAFYRWVNSFSATWPSLLREPESELVKVDAVKLESVIAQVQVLLPVLDPDNKAALIQYMVDNFNDLKRLFPNPLQIDAEALLSFLEEQKSNSDEAREAANASAREPSPGRKFGDSAPFAGLQSIRHLPVRGKARVALPTQ